MLEARLPTPFWSIKHNVYRRWAACALGSGAISSAVASQPGMPAPGTEAPRCLGSGGGGCMCSTGRPRCTCASGEWAGAGLPPGVTVTLWLAARVLDALARPSCRVRILPEGRLAPAGGSESELFPQKRVCPWNWEGCLAFIPLARAS